MVLSLLKTRVTKNGPVRHYIRCYPVVVLRDCLQNCTPGAPIDLADT